MLTELTICLLTEKEIYNIVSGLTTKIRTCFFCNKGIASNNEFTYAVTSSGKHICENCALRKDPQIYNIMQFICKSSSQKARLNKFNFGIPKLRGMIAKSDLTGELCPICDQKRVYYKECYNCGFYNLGCGLFRYENKVFNFYKAKKAFKMKAFL